MKYIEVDKLKAKLSELKEDHKHHKGDFHEGVVFAVDELEEDIDSLQHELASDLDIEKEIIRYQREDMDRDTTV